MQENKHKHKDTSHVDPKSMNDNSLSDTNVPITETGEEEQEAGGPGEIEKLKADMAEQKDKYLRLLAEFDNYKRRIARENLELRQTAGKEIIFSLLDVMDDCDRAEKQMQITDDVQQIKEGVQLVFNKLRNTLQSKGLKAMESINQDFDVEKHEAITSIPVDEDKKGKVVDEIVKGYYMNDKLIRFAKVVVGN